MATYRNAAHEALIVGVGLPGPVLVEPDATFEVPDEAIPNYDPNPNLVRVDTPAPPAEPAPAPEAPAAS